MPDAKPRQAAAPWGSVVALLGACFATIAGIVRGIEPDLILWRAVITAAIVGASTAVAICAAQWLQSPGGSGQERS